MTTPEAWLGEDRMLTVDDMENVPDDEFRYELDDGCLSCRRRRAPCTSWP